MISVKKYPLVMACTALWICNSSAMDDNNLPMIAINKLTDVTPFAGRVISYATTSSYFGSKIGYPASDAMTKYAYIHDITTYRPFPYGTFPPHDNPTTYGYEFYQILTTKECTASKFLDMQSLSVASLYIRHVTAYEAKILLNALTNGKAKFSLISNHKKEMVIASLELLSNGKMTAIKTVTTTNTPFIDRRMQCHTQ